jgi:hypothetical protein
MIALRTSRLNLSMKLHHLLIYLSVVFGTFNQSLFATGSALSALDADRPNDTHRAAAAAEAATEKVLSKITTDFLQSGENVVYANIPIYRFVVPLSTDNPYWTNYSFFRPDDGLAGTSVIRLSPSQSTILEGQFQGLSGYESIYKITSTAQLASNPGISSTTSQQITLETIPLFEFAIFYNLDLEMNFSPPMVITGRVHSNSNLWSIPATSLIFSNGVTTAGGIYLTNMPGDPSGNRGITDPNVIFTDKHTGGSSPLYLPIGTNNSPDNVYEVLKVPPVGENPLSAIGTNRFYNLADLIILVSNSTVSVTSGVNLDNRSTIIPASQYTNFLNLTNSFYDKREGTTIKPIDLDVAKLSIWIQTNTNITATRLSVIGKTAVNIVYVADFRTSLGASEPAVRLKNGSQLPATGLTMATPDPVYIQGDYNTKDGTGSSAGSNTTTHTAPACVAGDAITILSNDWQDANSAKSISNRPVSHDTTVNAAFLSGIVPTANGYYSGGVENFPRFLEDWSGKTLWLNGSMVVMFNSHIADAPWAGTGTVYNPPTRKWAFDTNFYDLNKLPPATPQLNLVERLSITK